MAKKVEKIIRLQIQAGAANPAPPVGPALGQAGVNIMDFCRQFNDATKNDSGMIIPVVITVYADRSFSFVTKSPPAAVLLKKVSALASGAKTPGQETVGKVTKTDLLSIARQKKNDLNSYDEEAAIKMIAGTARSMGIEVVNE